MRVALFATCVNDAVLPRAAIAASHRARFAWRRHAGRAAGAPARRLAEATGVAGHEDASGRVLTARDLDRVEGVHGPRKLDVVLVR